MLPKLYLLFSPEDWGTSYLLNVDSYYQLPIIIIIIIIILLLLLPIARSDITTVLI